MTFLSHSSGTLNRPIVIVEVPTAKSIVSRDRLKIEMAICAKHTLDMEMGDYINFFEMNNQQKMSSIGVGPVVFLLRLQFLSELAMFGMLCAS